MGKTKVVLHEKELDLHQLMHFSMIETLESMRDRRECKTMTANVKLDMARRADVARTQSVIQPLSHFTYELYATDHTITILLYLHYMKYISHVSNNPITPVDCNDST